jgi:hypothetical protein
VVWVIPVRNCMREFLELFWVFGGIHLFDLKSYKSSIKDI